MNARRRLLIILSFAVAVGVAVTAWLVTREVRSQHLDGIRSVEAQIQQLSTFTTARFTYRDVVYFDRRSQVFGIPTGQQELLFSVEIHVVAGIDLMRDFEVQPDPDDPRRAFVTLPEPEIVRVDADERSLHQYMVRERWGRIDWLDVSEEVERAKDRNRADAIERGILDRSRRQARSVVAALLRGAGFDVVELRFRPHTPEVEG